MNGSSGQKISFRNTFLALYFPNYRLWYAGQAISVIGTWMQSSAQGFLAFEITNSEAFLGSVSLAQGIPSILFMLAAGVLAERLSRRMLIQISQFWLMFLALTLALLTFLKIVEPWHLLVLSFLTGTANALSTPSRHAFVSEIVDAGALNNAISLNSTMFNLGTAIGPMVGGFIYKAVGPGWCFTLNGISFLAMIAGMAMMKLVPREPDKKNAGPQKKPWQDFIDGLKYVAGHKGILSIVVITGIFSFFGFSLFSMLPAWARDVLEGDAGTNGFLQSSRGLGALASALVLSVLAQFKIKGRIINIGLLAAPVCMVLFSFVNEPIFSFACTVLLGFSFLFVFNTANALVQSMVNPAYRGRVMSVYMLVFLGAAPLGAQVAGFVAEWAGLQVTIMCFGLVLAASAVIIRFMRPEVRTLP